MASRIDTTTLDSVNPFTQALWWADLLGYVEDADDPNAPDHEECLLRSPEGNHQILFIRVPDAKTVKNRMHFDLRPTDRSRDEEVERVLGLGAVQLDDQRQPDGTGWVVFGDPEGNEFCIVRSDSER